MARLGLRERWDCVFANEWCPKKAAAYVNRFGTGNPRRCEELRIEDVAKLTTRDLPGHPALVWGSFPCQDLSLAGLGAGLNGSRSGTFLPFWNLVRGLASEQRPPGLVVLENVVGTITSGEGRDFSEIVWRVSAAGYRIGALVIDAIRFLPQSRPRLFFVAVHKNEAVPSEVCASSPGETWHPPSLIRAFEQLSDGLRQDWIWWHLPLPPRRATASLGSVIEDEPVGVEWHSAQQTRELLEMMSDLNREKVRKAQGLRRRIVGTVYRRTRHDPEGNKVQRAEVRFDGTSGCLRTPAGGSSRQIIFVVEGRNLRSRLLSPREAARLMGVPEDYPIPANYNEAYHLFGDGLAVPAVAWLNENLLLPLAGLRSDRLAA